jgi:hypothetical protein
MSSSVGPRDRGSAPAHIRRLTHFRLPSLQNWRSAMSTCRKRGIRRVCRPRPAPNRPQVLATRSVRLSALRPNNHQIPETACAGRGMGGTIARRVARVEPTTFRWGAESDDTGDEQGAAAEPASDRAVGCRTAAEGSLSWACCTVGASVYLRVIRLMPVCRGKVQRDLDGAAAAPDSECRLDARNTRSSARRVCFGRRVSFVSQWTPTLRWGRRVGLALSRYNGMSYRIGWEAGIRTPITWSRGGNRGVDRDRFRRFC